jgi:hypothetical protein
MRAFTGFDPDEQKCEAQGKASHDAGLVSRPLVRARVSREIGIVRLRGRELTPAAAGLLALVKERLRRTPTA